MDTAAGSDASNKAGPVEGESLNWISLAGPVEGESLKLDSFCLMMFLYIAPAADVFSNTFFTINTIICKTRSNFNFFICIHVSYKF